MKHQCVVSKDRTNLFINKPDFMITPTTGKSSMTGAMTGLP